MTESERSQPGSSSSVERPDSMTRSEEELRVQTVRRAVERVRLVREVDTEVVTRTVEVRHERVRVERTPIEPGAVPDPGSTAPPADTEAWLVLYDEEVVLTTRRIPRERVRLRVESVTENREVTELLRRERIDVTTTEGDDAPSS